jgi:DNA-binding beta-propeller fold protein YncE
MRQGNWCRITRAFHLFDLALEMNKKALRSLHLLLVIPSLLSISATDPLLKRVTDFPLPGGTRRFDYQSLDPKRGHLFIAQMGEGRLLTFDVRKNKVVASLGGLQGATGVLAVPELNRVYVSVSGTGEIAIVDEDSLRLISKTAVGEFPDGLAYDPYTRKLFVSDEKGKAVIVVDTKTNRRIDRITIGGEVGNTQYDPVSHRIYSNVQSLDQLVAIDPRFDRIVARFPLKGGKHPHGLLIDSARRLAYVACDEDSKLLVFDLNKERVAQDFPVGKAPDVLSFDPGSGRLYVASESGTLSIFRVLGSTLKKEGDLFIAPGAHSVAVDPESHRVYLPLPNIKGRPVLRVMAPRPDR